MMRNAMLVLLFLAQGLHADPIPTLTAEFVRGKSFNIPMSDDCGIKFSAGYNYEFACAAEGAGFSTSGSWSVDAGILRLNQQQGRDTFRQVPLHQSSRMTECEIASGDDSDRHFELYLLCKGQSAESESMFASYAKGVRLGVPGTEPFGKERILEGAHIIVLRPTQAMTKNSVMLRTGPSLDSEPIAFSAYCMGSHYPCPAWPGTTAAFPGGLQLSVIGRTTAKSKVGQWEDYWYLLHGGYTWMFGAFLELQSPK